MPHQSTKSRLIKTHAQAGAVVCVTLFLAGQRFGELVRHHPVKSEWIYSGFFPKWFAVPANLLIYALFASLLVTVIRGFAGPERIILAILIAQTFVSPLRQYLPVAVAGAVFWIQAFASLVMLLASIHLFLSISEKQPSTAPPKAEG